MVINRVKQLLGSKKEAAGYDAPSPPAQQAMAPRPPAHTTSAPQEQAPAGAPSAPVSLDDYFDQLDAAFSNLQPASPVPEHDTSQPSGMDWSMPDTSSEDLPLKTPAPRATLPPVEQARPIAPPAPATLPPPLPPPVRPVMTAPLPLVRPDPPPAPVHQPAPPVAPPVAAPPVAGHGSRNQPLRHRPGLCLRYHRRPPRIHQRRRQCLRSPLLLLRRCPIRLHRSRRRKPKSRRRERPRPSSPKW